MADEKIKELAVSIEGKSLEEKKRVLAKFADTTLSSKLIGGEKEFFASMVVDVVLAIGNDYRLNKIGIEKVLIYQASFRIYDAARLGSVSVCSAFASCNWSFLF